MPKSASLAEITSGTPRFKALFAKYDIDPHKLGDMAFVILCALMAIKHKEPGFENIAKGPGRPTNAMAHGGKWSVAQSRNFEFYCVVAAFADRIGRSPTNVLMNMRNIPELKVISGSFAENKGLFDEGKKLFAKEFGGLRPDDRRWFIAECAMQSDVKKLGASLPARVRKRAAGNITSF